MTDFNSPPDKYSVTERLFTLIDDLSTDLQFILYKQLIKDNVATQLFKLIIDMSDEKKIQFLEKAGEMPIEEELVKTIDLDENESFMRENPRKICLIPVKCKIAGTSFKSYIINISVGGVFIETKDPFSVGHNMEMAFKLPNYTKTLEIKGQVTRSESQGISVIFFDQSQAQAQKEIICAYIAN